ncbi:MAG: sterol desaturase family protein [Gammaproteobacteria bacterium]|nr:sterol desaturase family protein [Gammaproteobacteria bacterium]
MEDFEQYYVDAVYGNPLLAYIETLSFSVYDWTLVFAIAFLSLEILNDVVTKRASGSRFVETLSSIATQIPFYLSEVFIFAGFVMLYFYIYDNITWQLPVTGWMCVVAVIAADFVYYWEHRAAHRIRLLWLAHSVHHSSPIMNTATAFRFSVFDPVLSGTFYLLLVLAGVHPVFVFAGEIMVQVYQFWIHNEMIGKLGPLEEVMNTPSHHRVHHGSDEKYLDKNYGGIFIIWDRMFGTFQREEEIPNYGLTTPINTVNPFKVQFYEFGGFFRDLFKAKSVGEWFGRIFKPPGWEPSK